MRHGQGTRYNTDVHDALSVIKKYNANQEIDEAPYSIGQRVGDTVKGVVPGGMGRMAKGRKESGKMANDVNKQWQSHLGKKGLKDQNAATVQDLSDFIERLAPGTDASAFYQKTGINATDPASTVPKKSQEAIILALAQSMNAAGGSTATATATATTATSGGTGGAGGAGGSAQAGVDFAKRAGGKKEPEPQVDVDNDGVDDKTGKPIAEPVDKNNDGKDDNTGEPVDKDTSKPTAKGAPGTNGATPPFEPGDPVQYTNAKQEIVKGNIVSGPAGEGENATYQIKGTGGREYPVVAKKIMHVGDKATKTPGLSSDGQVDILPPPEGDNIPDAEQQNFQAQVKIHNEVLNKVQTWSQASRDKLKAQLAGAPV